MTDTTDITIENQDLSIPGADVASLGKELSDLQKIVYNHKHMGYDYTQVLGSGNTRYILWRVIDPSAAMAVLSTQGGDLEIPFSATIVSVGAYVDTAGTTGTCTIDINLNGTTIMSSTKITIDSGEKTTRTAATPNVLTTTSCAVGNIFNVDIDAIQTTPARGLTVVLTLEI